jgi:flagellar L-ring protein precursor FlgH
MFKQLSVALLVTTALSACSAVDRLENIGEAPRLAKVGNPAGSQIVADIPRPAPITHVNNSLWQPGAASFFHDPRASNIGDVITVNVSTSDAAKLSNSTTRSRANSDDANLTNFFGLEKSLPSSMDPTSHVKMSALARCSVRKPST